MLGTTFGGAYLACAAAIAVLYVIKNEDLVSNSEKIGNYLMNELRTIKGVKEVRGLGLMIGVELEEACAPARNKLLSDYKIFTGSSSDKNTLRILPALNIKKEDIDKFLVALKEVLSK